MTGDDSRDAPSLRAGMLVTPSLRLVRALGAGGMGRVWVAEHLGLRTQIVVKFLARALAASPEAIARFSREAAAASQVKSPHVVHMIDHGVSESGEPYIAMELLEGMDLRERLNECRRLPPQEVVAIIAQSARALAAAHQRGIVHRDVKPENIFLTDAGSGELFVKVLDFGIAKSTVGDLTFATGTGAMVGTPLYMSPEQILGQKTVDFHSDLWSLGVVAFEALTGELPFHGETVGAVSVSICSGETPRPSSRNPLLGISVDGWFLRACARSPAHRFDSAKQLAESLASAISDAEEEATRLQPDLAQRLSVATAAAVSRTQATGTPIQQALAPAPSMLTTGAASSSSSSPARASRPRRLGVWLGGAALAGGGVGLTLFLMTRAPSAPAEGVVGSERSPAASASPSPKGSTTTTREPATATTRTTGTTSHSAPAVVPPPPPSTSAPLAATPSAPPVAATRPAPTAAILPATKPTPSPAPTPTRKKASDVVLE